MRNLRKFLIALLAFALLFAGARYAYEALSPSSDAKESSFVSVASDQIPASQTPSAEDAIPAPDFQVYDAEGKPVKLHDFLGAPVVLNFWASWCPPCVAELPDFDTVWQSSQEEITFLMVNVTDGRRETQDTADAFLRENAYCFPVYYDHDLHASELYGVYAIPMTFFIDSQGYLVVYATGAIDADALARGIEMVMPAGL
ncbi:MAG: TlpA family protein disulfide reductase [Clostridiales bacterium]|nr:TlpA family protein disulfide reductase [Clostridiales bacterium]